MKYRARFFRLTAKFMTSTHLPAYLVASFAKRLARLSLTASAAGAMVAIRLIYNLLKRHPQCKVLIHREPEFGAKAIREDPFVALEPDPAKSNALLSSLWEIQSVLNHYHPDVAKLPKVLEIPALGKPEMDVRRAGQATYISLFKAELKRSAAAFEPRTAEPNLGGQLGTGTSGTSRLSLASFDLLRKKKNIVIPPFPFIIAKSLIDPSASLYAPSSRARNVSCYAMT